MSILWAISALCSVGGGAAFVYLLSKAESSIHEATAAAIGLAIAVIPYCLARAWSEFNSALQRERWERREEERKKRDT